MELIYDIPTRPHTDLAPDEFAAAKQKTPEPLVSRQTHCTERVAAELDD